MRSGRCHERFAKGRTSLDTFYGAACCVDDDLSVADLHLQRAVAPYVASHVRNQQRSCLVVEVLCLVIETELAFGVERHELAEIGYRTPPFLVFKHGYLSTLLCCSRGDYGQHDDQSGYDISHRIEVSYDANIAILSDNKCFGRFRNGK